MSRVPSRSSTTAPRPGTPTAGRPELAIEHVIASGDVDAAARLVEEATLRTYQLGHGDRLERWLASFDDAVFERRPGLAVGAALVHALSGRPEAADHMADIVERSTFSGVPANGAASFESARAMLRAAMVRRGPDDAVENAASAVAAEGPGSPWRTLACEVLALGHIMRGEASTADEVLAAAVDAAPGGGSYAFYALALRASLAMASRDWEAATRYARESHERFERMHFDGAASSVLVHAVAARVAIHRGDLARGREELVHAQLVRPLASYALPSTAVVGLLEVARAYLVDRGSGGCRQCGRRSGADRPPKARSRRPRGAARPSCAGDPRSPPMRWPAHRRSPRRSCGCSRCSRPI